MPCEHRAKGLKRCILVAAYGVPCAAAYLVSPGCAGGRGQTTASPAVMSAAAPVVLTDETWSYAGIPGRMIRTRSYRLFTTARDPDMIASMPLFLERALEHYTTAMGPLPRPRLKLDTFLMGDRDQWERLTRQVMGPEAATYLRIQRGGFASGGRALLWTIGEHDTLAIAAHEGWHQYTQRTFREPLPVWLEEGIAAYMEGFVRDPADPSRPIFLGWANAERFDQLCRVVERGGLIPLERLIAQNPEDLINASTEGTLTYYAQLWALTHFLREGEEGKYRARLQALIADAAAGRMHALVSAREGREGRSTRSAAAVFRAYFGADLAAIGAEYDAFVGSVARPSARDRILRGEPPLRG